MELIDQYMPKYEVRERHSVDLRASPEHAYRVVTSIDFYDSALIRALFALRGLSRARPMNIQHLSRIGFATLAEEPGNEIVFGLVGRFWRPSGGLVDVDRKEFAQFGEPGYTKAVWSFRVERQGHQRARVSTETRVLATDPQSTKRFRRYWWLVGPVSALIRRRMLTLIKTASEL